MHAEVLQWVSQAVAGNRFERVIELGALNVNGGVRYLFPHAEVVGVDVVPGDGVDVVCDAADYLPEVPADCVVSTEMLEHTARAREVILAAFDMLVPGGLLVVTAAAPGRNPHSAYGASAPLDGEFYRNVSAGELALWLEEAGFERCVVDERPRPSDVRCVAYKPNLEPLLL
jgi:hypothetical protein